MNRLINKDQSNASSLIRPCMCAPFTAKIHCRQPGRARDAEAGMAMAGKPRQSDATGVEAA